MLIPSSCILVDTCAQSVIIKIRRELIFTAAGSPFLHKRAYLHLHVCDVLVDAALRN